MTLQEKCTGLELSKRLKELGVPQTLEHGSLAWCDDLHGNFDLHLIHEDNDEGGLVGNDYLHRIDDIMGGDYYKAFISDELGEMLPNKLQVNIPFVKLTAWGWYYGKEQWGCHYYSFREHETLCTTYAETQAHARAKMLEYLIINGYLDPKESQI